jgi:hypothetical protein
MITRFGHAPCRHIPYSPRASKFRTVEPCHSPPRAVRTPRALRASAIARCVVAPAASIWRMIGGTFAAKASASARWVAAPLALRRPGSPRTRRRANAPGSTPRARPGPRRGIGASAVRYFSSPVTGLSAGKIESPGHHGDRGGPRLEGGTLHPRDLASTRQGGLGFLTFRPQGPVRGRQIPSSRPRYGAPCPQASRCPQPHL